MNARTLNGSQKFRLRPGFWATPMACLAMGLALACSGGAGYGPDEDALGDENTDAIEDTGAVQDDAETVQDDAETVQDDAETVEQKALHPAGFVEAGGQKVCATVRECEPAFGPCDPPVEVNGRGVHCTVEVCKEKLVCVPHEVRDGDRLDGIDLESLAPRVDGLGGIRPIDPVPFGL